jgi:hypothetical protein
MDKLMKRDFVLFQYDICMIQGCKNAAAWYDSPDNSTIHICDKHFEEWDDNLSFKEYLELEESKEDKNG